MRIEAGSQCAMVRNLCRGGGGDEVALPGMTSSVRPRLRVLFVCSLNQWRSPTAEVLYRNDARLDVRSAGLRTDAKRTLGEDDVVWADVIFVMDREQKNWAQERFRHVTLPRIHSLDIPDSLVYMDPELQRMLRMAIDPEIDGLLKS
jgi:predicted protein tyrosine phosphatase